MQEPPQTVGASSDLAAAEEMPGCIAGGVKALYAVPYFLFWELPTLPLDVMIFAHEKAGRTGLFVSLVVMISAGAAMCWWLVNLVG